jgi:hypothetical protein
MKTKLNAAAAGPRHRARTVQLRFENAPKDQALYAALRACCNQDGRPLRLQIKYQLKVAMGLIMSDSELRDRTSAILDRALPHRHSNQEAADLPSTSTEPSTILRLIPGGAEKQERTIAHDNHGPV